jgi:hypothetical protein
VVLREDPTQFDPMTIEDIPVMQTIGGWREGLQGVDIEFTNGHECALMMM